MKRGANPFFGQPLRNPQRYRWGKGKQLFTIIREYSEWNSTCSSLTKAVLWVYLAEKVLCIILFFFLYYSFYAKERKRKMKQIPMNERLDRAQFKGGSMQRRFITFIKCCSLLVRRGPGCVLCTYLSSIEYPCLFHMVSSTTILAIFADCYLLSRTDASCPKTSQAMG